MIMSDKIAKRSDLIMSRYYENIKKKELYYRVILVPFLNQFTGMVFEVYYY